jgi:hypothetical protein
VLRIGPVVPRCQHGQTRGDMYRLIRGGGCPGIARHLQRAEGEGERYEDRSDLPRPWQDTRRVGGGWRT